MEQDEIRRLLAQEAARLAAMRDDVRTADDLDLDEQTEAGGELSVVDQHPADIATEQNQRAVDLSLLDEIEAELTDVERALDRLAAGTYGACEACGKAIGEERLKELPATPFCVEDARQRDLDAAGSSTAG